MTNGMLVIGAAGGMNNSANVWVALSQSEEIARRFVAQQSAGSQQLSKIMARLQTLSVGCWRHVSNILAFSP